MLSDVFDKLEISAPQDSKHHILDMLARKSLAEGATVNTLLNICNDLLGNIILDISEDLVPSVQDMIGPLSTLKDIVHVCGQASWNERNYCMTLLVNHLV